MAGSPFISQSPSLTVASPNTLRLQAASTSQKPSTSAAPAALGSDQELTEQINADVRQKYVKGMSKWL